MKLIIIDIDIQSNIYQNISNVLTKHVVLFGISIITNQSFFIYNFCASFERYYTHIATALVGLYGMRELEVTMNVIVLWLVLNINYDKYIRFCKCCHLCVSKCCIKNNQNPLQNPYLQLKE